MSMLAERKRKTKWVLNPTKKPLWTTDSNGIKFGKDLMERMGWSAGKGLGLKEQGIQEPLRVSYKNDTKGIGFKGNDDDWIEHQDEFNVLLSQLRNADDSDVVETSESKKHKVKSLEDKSKHSKARVHYQKFVRGKDLSKYSDNDLACILGINKAKKEKSEPDITPKAEESQNDEYETSFGVTTIKSGFIQDYFKKKWNFNKTNSGSSFKTNDEAPESLSESVTDSKCIISTNEGNEGSGVEEKENKKRKHKSETVSLNLEKSSTQQECDFPQTENEIEEKKSRKRKHKSRTEEELPETLQTVEPDKEKERKNKSKVIEMCFEEEPKVKKRKKNAKVNDEIESQNLTDDKSHFTVSNENSVILDTEEKKSKKKKHKSSAGPETSEVEEPAGVEVCQTDLPFEEGEKKHKHKNKPADDTVEKKHKSKRKRTHSDEGECHNQIDNLGKNDEILSFCDKESTFSSEEKCDVITEVAEKKSKKRKHKSKLEEVDTETQESPCKSNKELDFAINEKEEAEEKKSKKKKNKIKSDVGERDTETSEGVELENGSNQECKRKKRKKNSSENIVLGEGEETNPQENDLVMNFTCEGVDSLPLETEGGIVSSSKKKKKHKKNEKSEIIKEDERFEENYEKKEKKKKVKIKDGNNENLLSEENVETGNLEGKPAETGEEVCDGIKTVRKKKERTDKKGDSENEAETDQVEVKVSTKKKKSGKSEKVEKNEGGNGENESEEKGVSVDENNSVGVAGKEENGVENKEKPSASESQATEPFQYKSYTKQKVLDLICWADIKEFRGSNLGNVLGYGFKKEYLKCNELR